MEPTVETKPKHELKKVKDFQTVNDYFSYATTEFGNENVQFDGYKWTADDLFKLYLAGEKEAVLKLAIPETPDYSDLPFIKSNYDKPDLPLLKGEFPGEDVVQFPCKPAHNTVERYFEAKEWDHKLLEHPRYMNWWANRHLDVRFAKLELMDAMKNLTVTQQRYEEYMAQMEKDKDEVKKEAEKLRKFTIIFNNLAYHNIYKSVESEKKIQADLELNLKKREQGKTMMQKVNRMIVAQEDLKVRIEKMQIYEDFLNKVVESSDNKYENIQQILDRYDSVAYMKRQIVRNHLEDMFKLDVQKGTLMKHIAERQDIIRNYNNELSNLARRYKFVQGRYSHWENAVHGMKKLCNREKAQTQSVEASIWNLYVQMCARKKMPVKVEKEDYKAQLAYILITIKQYEKIIEIAHEKYELYLLTRTNSSMSGKTVGEKKEDAILSERETSIGKRKNICTQTTEVGYVDVSTMIWWEDEIRMTTTATPSPTPPVIEETLSVEEVQEGQEDKFTDLPEFKQESEQTDQQTTESTKLKDGENLTDQSKSPKKTSKQTKPSSDQMPMKITKQVKLKAIQDRKPLRVKQVSQRSLGKSKLAEVSKQPLQVDRTKPTKESLKPIRECKSLKQMDKLQDSETKAPKQQEPIDHPSMEVEPMTNKLEDAESQEEFLKISGPLQKEPLEPELLPESKSSVTIQTDEIESRDKNNQYEYFVTVHVQTLSAEELRELRNLQEQLEAEQKILVQDEIEVAWLKQATEVNLKLMQASTQRAVSLRTSESRHSFVKVDSADSIHSVESIKSRQSEQWDDSSAVWFYSGEWKESLDWGGEEYLAERRGSWESADVILPTGRRMSTAMKEHSIVMYSSDRRESSISFAPIQPGDRRESTATRESAHWRQLEPPVRRDSLGDGLLRRLRAALAEKDERVERDEEIEVMESREDRRDSAWTDVVAGTTEKEKVGHVGTIRGAFSIKKTRDGEQMKSGQIKPVEQEEIIDTKLRVLASTDERDKRKKLDIKPKKEQSLDWHEMYLKDLNFVDAWTQTLQEQTEDWVQTLPVKEQYGWTQTERIDKDIQTNKDDDEGAIGLEVPAEYVEASTQTDPLPQEKKSSERARSQEVSLMSEEDLKIPERTKLSAQLKTTSCLSSDVKSLSHADSVEERSLVKQLTPLKKTPKVPSASLHYSSLPGSREKSQEKPGLSIESEESKLPTSGAKSSRRIKTKTAVPLKSSSKPSLKAIASKSMVTIKEVASLITSKDVASSKKILTPVRSKELPKLPSKKVPLKSFKEETSLKALIQVFAPVSSKISRPCRQTVDKSVKLEKIHDTPSDTGIKEKRKLQKLKMKPLKFKPEVPTRVSWSGPKKLDDTSSKTLLPDAFQDTSSVSSSSSSSMTSIRSKRLVKKDKASPDHWKLAIDPSPRHTSLGIKEELSSLDSVEEWCYASSASSSEDLRTSASSGK